MPEEPNPRMDEMLKAYAKARREQGGTPPPLHPATRNLLQGEVTRTFHATGAAPEVRLGFWESMRARIVMVGSVCAALLIFGFVFLQLQPAPVERAEVAGRKASDATPAKAAAERRGFTVKTGKKDAFYAEESSPRATPPYEAKSSGQRSLDAGVALPAESSPAAAPPAPTVADSMSTISGRDDSSRMEVELMEKPQAAMGNAVTPRKAIGGGSAVTGPMAGTTGATARKEGTAGKALARTREQKAVARASKAKSPPSNMQFRQTMLPPAASAAGLAAPQPQSILNSFEMRRTDGEIRITDADGSTYVGQVDAISSLPAAADKGATATTAAIEAEAAKAPAENESKLAAKAETLRQVAPQDRANASLQDFSFCAKGLNRSLNQSVELRGRFVGDGNVLQNSTNLALHAHPAGQVPQPSAAHIQGQVLVGGTNTMELNAVMIEPE